MVISRNFKWNTTKFKIISYSCITLLNITFYFVEEFTIDDTDFSRFILFALSPLGLLLVDLSLKKISFIKYGRDFDFTFQSPDNSYFGNSNNYILLDKVFSIVLIVIAAGFPIGLASTLFQS